MVGHRYSRPVDLAGLTDDELLSRRHQAFLRVSAAHGPDPGRASAYGEIGLINRELARRRPPTPDARRHTDRYPHE